MSTQAIVELQINTYSFLSAQLLNLQTANLAFPGPMQFGPKQFVVDHIEFGSNSLDHSLPEQELIYHFESLYGKVYDDVPGFQVLLVQPFTVFMADLDDILAHPNQPPATLFKVPATMYVKLTYWVSGSGRSEEHTS